MNRKPYLKVFFWVLTATLFLTLTRTSFAQFTVNRAPTVRAGRVTTAVLKADVARVSGQCAMTVTFGGSITADGPATVQYGFTRSDGAVGPVQVLEFQEAGTQSVSTSWTLGDEKALPSYEGWQAIKVFAPNEIESSHETGEFSVKCEPQDGKGTRPNPNGKGPVPPAPSIAPPSPLDERGTFRVTLLGFVVNHETRDTLLETDGKRDEVYQVPVVLFFDRDTGLTARSIGVSGPVYGDTNNHPSYVRAGGASDRGGLQTGDPFPTARPWEGRTPPGPGFGFPSVLFEGELRPVHNAAVIIPSLWESDGNDELFRPYMDAIKKAVPTIRLNVGHLLASPRSTPYQFRPMFGIAFGLENTVTLDERILRTQDRPIGMERFVESPDRLGYRPQVLILTYEGARDAATRDNGFGPGVVEVRYDEPPELEGSYSLYFKVERVR